MVSQQQDFTRKFPDIQAALAAQISTDCVIDGLSGGQTWPVQVQRTREAREGCRQRRG
jgi:hypothetical protein